MRASSSVFPFLVLCSCGAAPAPVQPAAVAPPVAPVTVKRTTVFTGKGGIEVIVLELEGDRTLIQTTGASCAGDGLVLEHRRETAWNRFRYVTTVDGDSWVTFSRDLGSGAMLAAPPGLENVSLPVERSARSAAVDVQALLRLHREQTADGRIAKLQRFDRARRERLIGKRIRKALDDVEEECRSKHKLEVSWAGVTDARLFGMNPRLPQGCGEILLQVVHLCRAQPSPRDLFSRFDTIRCRYGGAVAVRALGKTLELTASLQANESKHQNDGHRALVQLRSAREKPLKAEMLLDQTYVCFADKGRVIIVAPGDSPHWGVSYGDGATFTNDRTKWRPYPTWFFDPRQFNKDNDPKYFGHDLRYYSHVNADPARQTCSVTCGERVTRLKPASRLETEAIVEKAVFKTPPQREAYALARDQAGTYFYVDRGAEKGGERDFRVFRGPRGKTKPLKMKDIVSDSEGDIFSTQDGKLRLLLSKSEAQWITRGKTRSLVLLPVKENYGLIYNELGVYLGERLGVPCDDL